MNMGVIKTIGAIAVSSTIVGGLATWEGGQYLKDAESFIQSATSKFVDYESNESRLLKEIDIKNDQIERLLLIIEELKVDINKNKERIVTLEDEVSGLKAERDTLLGQLSDLNDEVIQANSDALDLYNKVNSVNLNEYEPLVLDNLLQSDVIYLSTGTNQYTYDILDIQFTWGSSSGNASIGIRNKTEDIMSIEVAYDDEVVKKQVQLSDGLITIRSSERNSNFVSCKVFDKSERLILEMK